MQLTHAIEYAHSQGYVHRDINPKNVMIGSFGQVYLIDWGLAVAFTEKANAAIPRTRDIKGIYGTMGFLAPEMASGKGCTPSSYSTSRVL